jgi:hypothetical protein
MQSEQEQAQTLVIANKGPTPLEIMVEMTPELYVLQPGDELEIEAVLNGAPFHINTSVGGLQRDTTNLKPLAFPPKPL